jgi:hypothetical protein
MSIGSIKENFAINIAFSAVPPTPIPIIPGGHHPAPILGIFLSTHSVKSSSGLRTLNLALFSEPQPFAATIMSRIEPDTTLV